MNKIERIRAVMDGRVPDRIPIMTHTFLMAAREGALADLVLLRLNEPQFIPANNLVSGLVYSAKGSEVDTVLVDGRVLLQDGKLTTIDENRVYGEIRKITARLGMAG